MPRPTKPTGSDQTAWRLSTMETIGLSRREGVDDWVEVLGPGKPLALLIYLALAPKRTSSRERLLALFWSNVDPDRGRRSLRQTLWYLRQKLGSETLSSEDQSVVLALDVAVDVQQFDDALAEGAISRALEYYRGPFLPYFAVPGGVEFDHWADTIGARVLTSYLHAGEAHVKTLLDQGQPRDARYLAQQLRDASPLRESAWRLLFEALVACNDGLGAKVEADALARLLEAEGRVAEPATRKAQDALLDLAHVRDTAESGQLRQPELVGRDREFALIIRAWSRVAEGTGCHLHAVASPGLGKTRLLEETCARLAASGATTVVARGTMAQRTVPYALAADLVMSLSALPGSAGVSPDTARSLVALAPSVSGRFAAQPDPARGTEALRRRIIALAELVAAVADEAPLVILIDDLHWVDQPSRDVVGGLLSAISAYRTLVVTSSRPGNGTVVDCGENEVLALEPLTIRQVEELVSSVAALPEEPWVGKLIGDLFRVSTGVPLLVLETLQLALDQGVLQVREDVWRNSRPDTVVQLLPSGSALERRLADLDEPSAEILLALAVAGEPLGMDVVTEMVGGDVDAAAELELLEHRGFVTHARGAWRCGHDAIVEHLTATVGEETVERTHRRIAAALQSLRPDDASIMPGVARHLLLGKDRPSVERLFRRYVIVGLLPGDGHRFGDMARRLLGEPAADREVRSLVRSLPLHYRAGFLPGRKMAPSIAVGALVAVVLWQIGPWAEQREIVILTSPLSVAPQLVEGDTVNFGRMVPSPVVELRGGGGDASRTDSVTLRILDAAGEPVQQGRAVVENGRAVFDDIILTPQGTVRLEFSASGFPKKLSESINLWATVGVSRLLLDRAVVNGVVLTPAGRSLEVRPGDSIVGRVDLVYTSGWGAAAIMLGATTTWGDNRSAFVGLGPLATPVVDQRVSADFAFMAPARPGTYHIVFAFHAESPVEYVFSGTNWTMGHSLWNDGNDVADWTAEQMEQANRDGRVASFRVWPNRVRPDAVPATTLEVVVRPE